MNASIIGKYGNNGLSGFVIQSPIRYAICVNAGLYPTIINIGTNIGASIAHFADALPINKFIKHESIINPTNKAGPPIPAFSRNSPPLTAIIIPKLLFVNN